MSPPRPARGSSSGLSDGVRAERVLPGSEGPRLIHRCPFFQARRESAWRVVRPILGYFTLASTMAMAANWPGPAKGLPAMPVAMVLLGRLAVVEDWQGRGIARLLLAAAREIAAASMRGAGGIGMAVDPADYVT